MQWWNQNKVQVSCDLSLTPFQNPIPWQTQPLSLFPCSQTSPRLIVSSESAYFFDYRPQSCTSLQHTALRLQAKPAIPSCFPFSAASHSSQIVGEIPVTQSIPTTAAAAIASSVTQCASGSSSRTVKVRLSAGLPRLVPLRHDFELIGPRESCENGFVCCGIISGKKWTDFCEWLLLIFSHRNGCEIG